ncbi:MAG: 4-phosphoerythronate dehydrogenase [Bacteroidetes Order II. Incertae sedis bacterium]|nr:4-phosphoerythronate dehydrogenase [Bacteroidetes Order II. bacterium]
MKIVADENIPLLNQFFGDWGELKRLPGKAITPEVVREADVLLVRSVTPINPSLLQGSRVQFVATATAGTDHVDVAWLKKQGIGFAHAPGSNAESVVEYVLAGLLHLAVRHNTVLRGKTVGVVGVGEIGRRLIPRLEALGCTVLQNDPIRARHEFGPWTALKDLLQQSDVVTFHVPLTKNGPFPTYKLIHKNNLQWLKKGGWIVQTSRGGVIDEAALADGLDCGLVGAAILDVWENEPNFNLDLAARGHLVTPHIAGYSYDGKLKGSEMIYHAFCNFFGYDKQSEIIRQETPPLFTLDIPAEAFTEIVYLQNLSQAMYDIPSDDTRFRALIPLPPDTRAMAFHTLRKNYPTRYRFGRYALTSPVPLLWSRAIGEGLCLDTYN